jgi:hypothetical protein
LVSNYSQPKRGSVVPWSYSSLQQYETCPRRFYLTRIAKLVKEPQTDATMHGNEVHKALELAVGGTKGLDPKYAGYQPLVDKLRAAPGRKVLEYKFALTPGLKECDYWAPNVWVRGVIDFGLVRTKDAVITDYKTGKRKVDTDQLRLFAMAGFSLWSHVDTVSTGYIWLQSNQLDREKFSRSQVVEIHQDFACRVNRMTMSDKSDNWPPRPSGLCKQWCPVGKQLCEHCGK